MNPYKFLILFCLAWLGGAWLIGFAMGKILGWIKSDEKDDARD
jgi:hypothetical protein